MIASLSCDSSPHLPITLAADETQYWLKHVLHSRGLCVTARPAFSQGDVIDQKHVGSASFVSSLFYVTSFQATATWWGGGREQCLTVYNYVHNTLESELLISQSEYLPIL